MAVLRDALRELPGPVFADWYEGEEAYLAVFDLPGVAPEDADVRVEDGRLRVDAHRRKEESRDGSAHVEQRSIAPGFELPLPPDVDEAEASATLNRGVLEVSLPRCSTHGTTTIPVGE